MTRMTRIETITAALNDHGHRFHGDDVAHVAALWAATSVPTGDVADWMDAGCYDEDAAAALIGAGISLAALEGITIEVSDMQLHPAEALSVGDTDLATIVALVAAS